MFRALLALLAIGTLAGVAIGGGADRADEPGRLAPVAAVGLSLDTLLIGGYAGGSFVDAVASVAADLSEEERLLVGLHLERIFAEVLPAGGGVGRTGRLRLAYERAARPDGSTRSIRVLGAEIASSGRVHTAFYFEREGRPGYFDPFGRPLEAGAADGPLRSVRVSSPFGDRRLHPILKRILPHTGVDLAAPAGEPVRATSDGIVKIAGDGGGYGLLVELQHPDGYGSRYAHLSRIAAGIAPAKLVRQGDVLGYVGMTGLATGPHLHYEVRRRGQPVDPMIASARVAFGQQLGSDPRWSAERRALSALLARTPTVVQPIRTAARTGY